MVRRRGALPGDVRSAGGGGQHGRVATDDVLAIVQVGDPVLRRPAEALSEDQVRSAEVQRLVEAMRATMHAAPGVGLAAPQVGESIQLVVVEDDEARLSRLDRVALALRRRRAVPFQVLVNPTISPVEEVGTATFFEGCLSATGLRAAVPRHLAVRVEALDRRAEPVSFVAEGWHARIVQHEVDHLRGTLYVDRMLPRSLTTDENHDRFWEGKPVDQVLAELGADRPPA